MNYFVKVSHHYYVQDLYFFSLQWHNETSTMISEVITHCDDRESFN